MPTRPEQRRVVTPIQDTDWYLAAYMRCCLRIEDEEKRSGGKNLERLQRRLQALFDKLVKDLEDDRDKARKEREAARAINHAVTDRGLPRTMLRVYENKRG